VILETASLVTTVRRGREKLHYLNAAPISVIADRWISRYDRQRVDALADLRKALEATEMERAPFLLTLGGTTRSRSRCGLHPRHAVPAGRGGGPAGPGWGACTWGSAARFTATPTSSRTGSWASRWYRRSLRHVQLIGADIVEVAPAYDHAQITGIAAAHVGYELLSALAAGLG
jgi:hypothetical protein